MSISKTINLAAEAISIAKSFLIKQPLESFFPHEDEEFLKSSLPAVFLVPGYMERPGCFWELESFLKKSGYRVFLYRPQKFLISIEEHAELLNKFVEKVRASYGLNTFSFMGHSMGGLIVRKAAISHFKKRGSKLKAVFTVASPNSGTMIAHLGLGKCTSEMLPGSSFLKKLDKEDKSFRKQIISFSCDQDLLVPDLNSSRLLGSRQYILENTGHLSILSNENFLGLIRSELYLRMPS